MVPGIALIPVPLTGTLVPQCLTGCGILRRRGMTGTGDRLGRRGVLMAFTLAFFVMVYPLYVWVAAAPSIERLLVMQQGRMVEQVDAVALAESRVEQDYTKQLMRAAVGFRRSG